MRVLGYISFRLYDRVPPSVLLGKVGSQTDRRSELIFQLQIVSTVDLRVGQGAEDAGAGYQGGVLIDYISSVKGVPIVFIAHQRSQGRRVWRLLLPEFIGEQPLVERQYGNATFKAGRVVIRESQEAQIGGLAFTQTGRKDQRFAKEGCRQGFGGRQRKIHAIFPPVSDIGQINLTIRLGKQFLIDIADAFVVLDDRANGNGRHPIVFAGIFLDQQSAEAEVVQPQFAAANIDVGRISKLSRERSETEIIRGKSKFNSAAKVFRNHERIKALALQANGVERHRRLAEDLALRCRIDQIGHRRNGAAALAFNRDEGQRRSFLFVLGKSIRAKQNYGRTGRKK